MSVDRGTRLRPPVVESLRQHGIDPQPQDTPSELRDKLNDVYLGQVRRIKEQQRAGQIARKDYAGAVERLKQDFQLLGLPLSMWVE